MGARVHQGGWGKRGGGGFQASEAAKRTEVAQRARQRLHHLDIVPIHKPRAHKYTDALGNFLQHLPRGIPTSQPVVSSTGGRRAPKFDPRETCLPGHVDPLLCVLSSRQALEHERAVMLELPHLWVLLSGAHDR